MTPAGPGTNRQPAQHESKWTASIPSTSNPSTGCPLPSALGGLAGLQRGLLSLVFPPTGSISQEVQVAKAVPQGRGRRRGNCALGAIVLLPASAVLGLCQCEDAVQLRALYLMPSRGWFCFCVYVLKTAWNLRAVLTSTAAQCRLGGVWRSRWTFKVKLPESDPSAAVPVVNCSNRIPLLFCQ